MNPNAAESTESSGTAAGWYAVFVLILAYTCSYIDRTILTLLVKPIRASLEITDVQFSLLHGLAFAVFYCSMGVPIARLADRGHRVRLITAGVAVWSLMTALCGLARHFWQLFLARVGVGIGEAALSPAAYSILSDYFKGSALARALSVYTASIYLGAGLAMIVGGAAIAAVSATTLPVIGPVEPWQVVFLVVGVMGLPVMLLMLTVREPARTGLAEGTAQVLPFRRVVQFMNERRGAYWLAIAGYSLMGLVWNGCSAWIPSFFIRHFNWTPAQVGLRFGTVLLIFGTLGVISGGYLSGVLRRRGHRDANLLVGFCSAVLIIPSGVLAPLLTSPMQCLYVFAIFVFFASLPYGCAAAAFQELTPNQMRAQVSALYFLILNLAGIGLGPTVVALIAERGFGSDMAIHYGLVLIVAVAAPLAAWMLWRARAPFRQWVID